MHRPDENPTNMGMRELLASLPQSELAGLLKTVTNSLVRFGSVPRDENGKPLTDPTTHAINSILMYGDATSLFNRQKMKKEYIAEYLNQKGVKMTMPATKNSLCQDVLNFWGQSMPANVRVIEDEAPRRVSDSENNTGAITNGSEIQNNLAAHENTIVSSERRQSSTTNHGATSVAQSHDVSIVSNMEYECAASLRQREANLGQQLGREFSAWYYERLNTLTDFTVSHFWDECNFRLEIIFAADPENTLIDEIMMNGEATCAKIKDLVAVKSLYFDPNTTDAGIRGYLNPHGLAQVMVCGVIHHKGGGGAVGVFEQMFGLMKDPRFGSNYKIKFSVLRLREGNFLAIQSNPPELCDTSLVGIVEEIDDD